MKLAAGLPVRVLALVGLLVLVAAGGAGYLLYLGTTREVATEGGTIVEGLVVDGPLSVLPPFAADTQNSHDIASHLYRGLTRIGAGAHPVPGLASSWTIDPTATVYTFHLRPGLRWSDGVPLTSADAVFTLHLLQDPALAQAAVAAPWTGITVEAPDPLTLVYKLPNPSGPFLSQASLGLVPEHFLRTRPIGTMRESIDAPTSGPFRVSRLERDRLLLSRNSRAFEPPLVDGLEFRLYTSQASAVAALLSGEIDVLAGLSPADAGAVSGAPNRRVVRTQSFAYIQLLFNQKQGPLADLAVRRAIAQAVDRTGIIRTPLRGYGHLDNSPIPPAIAWAAAPVGVGRDSTAAAAALTAAGWLRPGGQGTRVKDGNPLMLRLSVADLEPYRSIAVRLRTDLAAVGVEARLDLQSQDVLVGQVLPGRAFDMALTAVDNGPDPDFFVFWHSSQQGAGGLNFSGMPKSVFLDKDLEDGRSSADIPTRRAAYADAQKILADNQPAVFLVSPDTLIGFNARVLGVRLDDAIGSGDRYAYVSDWYVQTRRQGIKK